MVVRNLEAPFKDLDDLWSVLDQISGLLTKAESRWREMEGASRTAMTIGRSRPVHRSPALEVVSVHGGKRAEPSLTDRSLTDREVQVLRLVTKGLPNAGIAAELTLSAHTIHRHVSNILTKLDVSSRAAAVAKATELSLL